MYAEKSFSLSDALHELKKRLFRESKNFISRKLYKLHSKPLFYGQKLLLHVPFFAVRKNFHFHKPKGFLFQKALCFILKSLSFSQPKPLIRTTFYCPQKSLFYVQKPFFCTSLSLLVSKNAHFHRPKALLLPKPFLIAIQSYSFPPSAFHFNAP